MAGAPVRMGAGGQGNQACEERAGAFSICLPLSLPPGQERV